MIYTKTFKQISKNDVDLVGGKGASLGEMANAGIPVPPGFVITTRAFRKFQNQELSVDVKMEILDAFDNLGSERVAVRSSAVAEDSSTASWAGQLESYLNVDRDNLIESIRKCWTSIKSERALAYIAQQNISEDKLLVAVVIQKMVNSEISGVIFSVNPISNNANEIMIEAGYGLGEMIVQGMITPDNFIVDKKTYRIKGKSIQSQDKMLVFRDGKNQEINVPANIKDTQCISDDNVKSLAKLASLIENHYGFPCDIEWAKEEKNLYIVQSRPITTLGN